MKKFRWLIHCYGRCRHLRIVQLGKLRRRFRGHEIGDEHARAARRSANSTMISRCRFRTASTSSWQLRMIRRQAHVDRVDELRQHAGGSHDIERSHGRRPRRTRRSIAARSSAAVGAWPACHDVRIGRMPVRSMAACNSIRPPVVLRQPLNCPLERLLVEVHQRDPLKLARELTQGRCHSHCRRPACTATTARTAAPRQSAASPAPGARPSSPIGRGSFRLRRQCSSTMDAHLRSTPLSYSVPGRQLLDQELRGRPVLRILVARIRQHHFHAGVVELLGQLHAVHRRVRRVRLPFAPSPAVVSGSGSPCKSAGRPGSPTRSASTP